MQFHVLLLIDDVSETSRILAALGDDSTKPSHTRVESSTEVFEAMFDTRIRCVIASEHLAWGDDAQFCISFKQTYPDVPLILLSDAMRDEVLVQIMRSGVNDVVFRDRLSHLRHAVARELQSASRMQRSRSTETKLLESELLHRNLIDQISDGVLLIQGDRIIFANAVMRSMLQSGEDDLVRQCVRDLFDEGDLQRIRERAQGHTDTGSGIRLHMKQGSGKKAFVDVRVSTLLYCGSTSLLLTVRDLSGDMHARRNIAQYAFIAEAVNEFILITDASGSITYLNAPVREYLKAIGMDALGKNINALFPIDMDAENPDNVLQRVLRREDWEEDVRLKNDHPADGPLWLSVTASLLEYEGAFLGIVWIARDISEQLRMLEELRRSKGNIQALIENTPDAIWSVDRDYRLVVINETFRAQFLAAYGLQIESGMRITDLFPQNYSATWIERYSRALDGESFSIEESFRFQGTDLHTEISFQPIREGEIVRGVSVFSRDITERKAAEEAIRQSEENFRTLTEESLVGVYVIQDGRFTYINPTFAGIFGYSVEEILGMTMIQTLIHPDDQTLVLENIQRRLKGEMPRLRYNFRAKTREDATIIVEVIGSYTDYQGQPAIIGTLIDVTEQKHVEEQLITAKERAELSDRLKDSFIANISHEIRTPLNIIMGYGSLMYEELDRVISPEQEGYFHSIQRAGERLMRTVELILNMSSIQSGTFRINPEPIEINTFLQRLHGDLQHIAHKSSLQFDFKPLPRNRHIVADRYCLEQALTNVIENAFKFTTKGGVKVSLAEADEAITISVADSGIGIDDEYLPRLFQPFTQEGMGFTRPYDGLGLGLALTSRYVMLNNGSIEVQSEKGVGSTFLLRFPLTPPTE